MADQDPNNPAKTPGENEDDDNNPPTPPKEPSGEKDPQIPADVLKKAVDEALAPIKAKLDDAYAKRDEALAKAAEAEEAKKTIERERMREQGKETEALQSELEDLKAQHSAKDKKILELTRNMEVNSLLSGMEFRNDKSRKMAFEEIVNELVQDEDGQWKHKSGTDLNSHVDNFAKDEDNSFLFKAKESTGAGSPNPKPSSPSSKSKSLFDMDQDEVLRRAAEGTLRK